MGTGRVPWAHLLWPPCHPTKHRDGCAQREKHPGMWDWSRKEPFHNPPNAPAGAVCYTVIPFHGPPPQQMPRVSAATGICLVPAPCADGTSAAALHPQPRNPMPGGQGERAAVGLLSSWKARVPELEMPTVLHTAHAQTRALYPCRKRHSVLHPS